MESTVTNLIIINSLINSFFSSLYLVEEPLNCLPNQSNILPHKLTRMLKSWSALKTSTVGLHPSYFQAIVDSFILKYVQQNAKSLLQL